MWMGLGDTLAPALRALLENIVKEISMSVCLSPVMRPAVWTVCSLTTTISAAVALVTQDDIVSPWWICVCRNLAITVGPAR